LAQESRRIAREEDIFLSFSFFADKAKGSRFDPDRIATIGILTGSLPLPIRAELPQQQQQNNFKKKKK